MLNIFLFILIFAYITNWKRLRLFPKALINPVKNLKPFHHKKLEQQLKQKLNTSFEIKEQNSELINGYMPGIPIKPVMVVTSAAVKKLSEDELEFVILHEAGHCLNWHTLKDIILWVMILTLSIILLIKYSPGLLVTTAAAFLLSIFWVQLERRHEIAADQFALENGADPNAMISFFNKVMKQYQNPISQNKILSWLFNSHPHYQKRIQHAEKYLKKS